MAFDGLTLSCLRHELNEYLTDARVVRIAQTESDEVILTFKCARDLGRGLKVKLLMSASPSLPMVRLTDETKPSPLSAPSFCMLLRKHLENGRVMFVEQPGFERVIRIGISHFNEMGDLKTSVLIAELMGKHSNIILINDENVILDSIRHIPSHVSSVREVLPGREYFLPNTQDKKSPLEITDIVTFSKLIGGKNPPDIHGALVNTFTGISPVLSEEICFRAMLDATASPSSLTYENLKALFDALNSVMNAVKTNDFSPAAYYENNKKARAAEFAAVNLYSYESYKNSENGAPLYTKKSFNDMSSLLEEYYKQKSVESRVSAKSHDLRHLVQTLISRTSQKYDKQLAQLKDTEKREQLRRKGELLKAYAYTVEPGAKEVKLTDYDTGEDTLIRLDENLSAQQNAQKYFERYARMKRTYETLTKLTAEVKKELDYLESVSLSLKLATGEEDLNQIRRELTENGFIKEKSADKKHGAARKTQGNEGSSPMHFITTDGFHVYVGKNNFQNDRLTFHSQGKDDWWFHAKQIPGSHVVLKADGRDIPDRAFEEAAALAAHFSSASGQDKVEVDYVGKKNVKKPSGAKPGFVVYYTNYSMMAQTDISGIKQAEDIYD